MRPLIPGERCPLRRGLSLVPLVSLWPVCGGPLPSLVRVRAVFYIGSVLILCMEAEKAVSELRRWCRKVGGYLDERDGVVYCWLDGVGIGVGDGLRVVDRRNGGGEFYLPYVDADVQAYETPGGMKCFGTLADKREVPQLFVCVSATKRRGFYFFYRPRRFGAREVVKREFAW